MESYFPRGVLKLVLEKENFVGGGLIFPTHTSDYEVDSSALGDKMNSQRVQCGQATLTRARISCRETWLDHTQ